jgi:hypothetical protein
MLGCAQKQVNVGDTSATSQLTPGWSANRKLSGFDGGISPVKSASRQEIKLSLAKMMTNFESTACAQACNIVKGVKLSTPRVLARDSPRYDRAA